MNHGLSKRDLDEITDALRSFSEIEEAILFGSRAGVGAKVVDRLSHDLRDEFPDLNGFSPRNLKYMRKFAEIWPEREIVQEALARITWYHNLALMEKCKNPEDRLWSSG